MTYVKLMVQIDKPPVYPIAELGVAERCLRFHETAGGHDSVSRRSHNKLARIHFGLKVNIFEHIFSQLHCVINGICSATMRQSRTSEHHERVTGVKSFASVHALNAHIKYVESQLAKTPILLVAFVWEGQIVQSSHIIPFVLSELRGKVLKTSCSKA